MNRQLTPYDTGAVLEPKLWVTHRPTVPLTEKILDRYGKVDFDNDESATELTLRVTAAGEDELTIEIDRHSNNRLTVNLDGETYHLRRVPKVWVLDGCYGTTAYTLYIHKQMGQLSASATVRDLWNVPELEPVYELTDEVLAQTYYLAEEPELPIQ